jgi:hypothetical protein
MTDAELPAMNGNKIIISFGRGCDIRMVIPNSRIYAGKPEKRYAESGWKSSKGKGKWRKLRGKNQEMHQWRNRSREN